MAKGGIQFYDGGDDLTNPSYQTQPSEPNLGTYDGTRFTGDSETYHTIPTGNSYDSVRSNNKSSDSQIEFVG